MFQIIIKIIAISFIIFLIIGYLWMFIEERAMGKRFSENIGNMFKTKRMNQGELLEAVRKSMEESKKEEAYEKQHPFLAKIKRWREYYYI